MNIDNTKLKEMMESTEELSDEMMESFVYKFVNANLIILCESGEEELSEELELKTYEEIENFDIIKLEDEDGCEFIPLFTDENSIMGLDIPSYGVVISTSDLVNLLHDNEENNENLEGLILNPFTDNSAEIDYYSLLELFGLEECSDPNCNHEHHHH